MNRSTFVKSMFALTGTAFVYGCRQAEELAVNPDSSTLVPDLEQSQKWFSNTYIPQFTNKSARVAETSVNRTLDWSGSEQVQKGKENFIWVPVKYDSDHIFPRLVTWKDGQEYIPKLAQYLNWMIAEGFIVWRDSKGDYQGFLAQIAYDPYKHKPGKAIDSNHFTGMIIHAGWDESPLRVWRFLDGSLESSFNSEKQGQGRLKICNTVYYNYNTVTGQSSCGPNCWSYSFAVHSGSYTYCDDGSGSGTSGSGSQGYPYYGGGGSGGTTTPPSSGGPPPFQGYNFTKVAAKDGSSDYQIFMQRGKTFLDNFSIPATTFGLSLTYADTMVKALGIEGAGLFNLGTTQVTLSGVSNTIGFVGVGVGAVSIGISYIDRGYLIEADIANIAAVALGVISLSTPIGWVVISTAVASAVFAFYGSAIAPHSVPEIERETVNVN